ncbi:CpaD family pilus assembly protein [Parasphingopyxis marina]|uniref:CpaD family pilus assembly protein n=1 Tax=Parasphingopyxis marina TaxID=2761622 RepID=A0A842HU38_9SPHN|nr:CpaD family pilus assembly protein [Parasphingopyxis marina]MBC2777468.1 CpaD family pilus assembly protein [Parasphingopyxis marina]
MRTLATFTLLAVAGTLSGCAAGTGTVNPTVYSVNQPVVSRTDYVFDVNAGSGGLSYGDQARLADWFEALELGYGDRVSIEDPSPYGAPDRRASVADIAGRYGLLLADRAPVTAGAIPPGQMRVIISRTRAEVPNCPNWDRESNGEFRGSATSNYGCAINSNVAAMVANPEDLIRGQTGDGSGDPRTTARAIGTYRSATPTGAGGQAIEAETTAGGN